MPMSDYMRDLRARVGNTLLEVPSVTVVVRDSAARVLLVRHSEGVWVLPGGAIEPAEVPADAAVREMWEETGLIVRPTRLACVCGGPEFVVRYANGDATSYLMVVFEADVLRGDPKPDGVEVLELRYVAPDDLGALQVAGWLPEVLQRVSAEGEQHRFSASTWRPEHSA